MSLSTERVIERGYEVTLVPGIPVSSLGTWDLRWLDGLVVVYQMNGRMARNYVGQYECPALYIGRTEDLTARAAAHAREKAWWGAVCCVDVDICPSIEVAIAHEQARIRGEVPLFNSQHNRMQPRSWREVGYDEYYARYRGVDWTSAPDALTDTMVDGILYWDNQELDEANNVVSDDPVEYDAALKLGEYE